MNGWMDAKQGNPVHTPARATLAGATDDDACMVLLYNATKAISSCPHTMRLRPLVLVRSYSTMRLRLRGKVFVLVHIKIWIGILMYEKSSMMLTGFIRLRQRAQCKFRSPTFIGLPIVSVRLIMPTLKFNASIRF